MSIAYEVKAIKNCRKHLKKCYLIHKEIDDTLIENLNDYGILEIMDFSAFTPQAKPCFKIKCFDELEISGVLKGRELFVVIAKTSNLQVFEEIESIIDHWFHHNLVSY